MFVVTDYYWLNTDDSIEQLPRVMGSDPGSATCWLCYFGQETSAIYLFILAVPRGLQDLSSPTRDQTRALNSENAES